MNRGLLCPKGLSEHHTIDATNRAKYPLLRARADELDARRPGRRRSRRWPRGSATCRQRYGRQAVGVISTGQLVTEEFYTLGKLVQLGIGTSNYDGNTTLCMSTAVAGYKRSFGSDGPPGAYEDFEHADVILLIGANIADNHPILCRRLQSNPNKTLIVVDPRVTKTAMLADLHLPIRPRSDLALINGLIHIVIEHDLIDREYIERHTTGFEALRESVREYTPERVAEITGLAPELIYRTAWLYANAERALIAWTMGVNHSTKGTETVNAINNLALITGNIGRAGAAPFSITGQCNAMGTREAGFASSMPGYRKFESAADREELAALWNVPVERIPTARGLAYPDIIEAALDKRIRALWIIATNPIVSFPNLGVAAAGARRARVPRRAGRLSSDADLRVRRPRAPGGDLGREGRDLHELGAARQQGESRRRSAGRGASRTSTSFSSLPARSACATSCFRAGRTPADAFDEWKRVSAGRLCDYSGMTYEAIEEHGGIQWPFPEGATNPQETRRLYTDGVFQTDDGRARLLPVAWEPFPEQPTTAFPLVLNTGRTVEHWHTRTKTANVPILERLSPNAWVEMNPRDARAPRAQSRRTASTSSRGAAGCATSSCASPRPSRRDRSSCRSTTPRPTRTR